MVFGRYLHNEMSWPHGGFTTGHNFDPQCNTETPIWLRPLVKKIFAKKHSTKLGYRLYTVAKLLFPIQEVSSSSNYIMHMHVGTEVCHFILFNFLPWTYAFLLLSHRLNCLPLGPAKGVVQQCVGCMITKLTLQYWIVLGIRISLGYKKTGENLFYVIVQLLFVNSAGTQNWYFSLHFRLITKLTNYHNLLLASQIQQFMKLLYTLPKTVRACIYVSACTLHLYYERAKAGHRSPCYLNCSHSFKPDRFLDFLDILDFW